MKIRTAIVGLVLALLALIVVPQRDAAVVVMRNTPQLARMARAIPAPAIERSVAATPGDQAQTGALYVPVANSNAPGVLLVNGAEVPGGWRNPDIETLATSIADLGLAVYVPDLPGVEHGSLSVDALNALEADQAWFTQQRGRDSLVGVCVGASLSLLVAANAPSTVHSVVAIDPYASLSEVLRAATTGSEMVAWVRADLVRSLATTIPDGQALIQALTQSPPDDPLAGFRREPPAIDATSQAWWRLLGNTDPSRFQNLYDALPQGVRSQLEQLSPQASVGSVQAPILIAAPYHDFAFPPTEATNLQQANPAHVRLTRTSALDHVTPTFSPSVIVDYWKLWSFAGAAIQALR